MYCPGYLPCCAIMELLRGGNDNRAKDSEYLIRERRYLLLLKCGRGIDSGINLNYVYLSLRASNIS